MSALVILDAMLLNMTAKADSVRSFYKNLQSGSGEEPGTTESEES